MRIVAKKISSYLCIGTKKRKDRYDTANERYQKTLTVFEKSLRRGRQTKLSDICSDNKVYYRGMLKWLYRSGLTIADIRKGIVSESGPVASSEPKSQSSFVELSNVPKAENSGFSSHILANVKLNIGTSIRLTMENADAGALAESGGTVMASFSIISVLSAARLRCLL